jgi:hypothetical protein
MRYAGARGLSAEGRGSPIGDQRPGGRRRGPGVQGRAGSRSKLDPRQMARLASAPDAGLAALCWMPIGDGRWPGSPL